MSSNPSKEEIFSPVYMTTHQRTAALKAHVLQKQSTQIRLLLAAVLISPDAQPSLNPKNPNSTCSKNCSQVNSSGTGTATFLTHTEQATSQTRESSPLRNRISQRDKDQPRSFLKQKPRLEDWQPLLPSQPSWYHSRARTLTSSNCKNCNWRSIWENWKVQHFL